MNMVFAIAAGGALGALGRHYFAQQVMRWTGDGFPWGIFATNVLGSCLMGVLVQALLHLPEPMPGLRAFLAVGVLGAFTTFSTFSLDVVLLIERGAFGAAAGYALGSVILSVLGLFAGMSVVKFIVG